MTEAAEKAGALAGSGDAYALDVVRLVFRDPSVEARYVAAVLARTMTFCRLAWAMVLLLGVPFVFLDPINFPNDTTTVMSVRAALMLLALGVLGASYVPGLRRLFTWSSVLFVVALGGFCSFLVLMSPPETMSVYFAGLFFGFSGVFGVVGHGFGRNTAAIAATLTGFLIAVAGSESVSTDLLLTYAFFCVGTLAIFGVVIYLVERLARDSYASGMRLADSLADLRRLSGLLPICAGCKSIRDDQGYWAEIEHYISDHSEAIFSHGLCPTCAVEMYPEFADEPVEVAEDQPSP